MQSNPRIVVNLLVILASVIGNVIGNTTTDFYRLFGLSWEIYTTSTLLFE